MRAEDKQARSGLPGNPDGFRSAYAGERPETPISEAGAQAEATSASWETWDFLFPFGRQTISVEGQTDLDPPLALLSFSSVEESETLRARFPCSLDSTSAGERRRGRPGLKGPLWLGIGVRESLSKRDECLQRRRHRMFYAKCVSSGGEAGRQDRGGARS